jgi:hypothetical protein
MMSTLTATINTRNSEESLEDTAKTLSGEETSLV